MGNVYVSRTETETHLPPSLGVGGECVGVKVRERRCTVTPHDCKRQIARGRCVRPRYFLNRYWTKHTVRTRRGYFTLVAKRYWGVSIWSAMRDGVELYSWPECDTYQEMTRMKRRSVSTEPRNVLHLAAVDSDLMARLLPVVQHCSHVQYEDGSPRKPGWITIKTMGSAWVVEAKDPDSCSRLTVVQQTLDEALVLISLLLESDEAPWEQDPWLRASEAKGKKK